MSLDEFKRQMYTRSGVERLPMHLEGVYGIRVEKMTELDLGVYRVERSDGPTWVARLFPSARSLEHVQGDAEILQFLANHEFPAERCAHETPVSMHEGQGVLITNYVEGTKPKGTALAYQFLGFQLGKLHSLPFDSEATARIGGAWHHVCAQGGQREELDAIYTLLTRELGVRRLDWSRTRTAHLSAWFSPVGCWSSRTRPC